MRNTLYIFDISNMIHRAFHATGELSTSYGFPTGAIWGTLSMMLRFIDKYKPTHMLICYDSQTGNSVRKNYYPEYKANRTAVNAVSEEEKILRRIFQMLNIHSLELDGYEADDMIATAVANLKTDMDIVIITGDKDMLQLIEPGVRVLDTMKNVWYDEAEALKKFGVRANQISDYLAIAGDASDNIPGVTGIGPKGAAKLLDAFPNVEEIYANLDKVDVKLRKKLEDCVDLAKVSKQLASLMIVDTSITPDDTIFQPTDNPDLFILLDKLEFTNIKVKLELMWQNYND
jgi:DNA polymerase-1